MEKTPNDATVPDWSDHPVDVLKWCAEQAGRELNPEAEAQLRAICDEPVDMSDYIARKFEMNKPSILPPHIHNEWDWREVPMPAPARIVETTALPAPVRVKGVIE